MGVKIREKRPGEWWLFIHHQGKRRSKKIGPKREALRLQKELQQRIAAGSLGLTDHDTLTLGDCCRKWIEDYAPLHVKASTLTDYQSLIRNHLGNSDMWDTSVDQISRTMIEDFLVQKRRNLSASTTKHIRTVIKQSLDRADLPVNPCSGVKVLERKRANGKHKISVYTESEVEHLLDTFRQYAPRYYLLVLFLVRTGCRTSEVAALQWNDIDLDNRIATICRGLVRGKIEDSTKSGLDRDIDLTPQLTQELRKAKIASGGKGLVFKNPEGNAVNFNLFRRRAYSKMMAKAGLKPTRLHDLRHTYASILLKKCRDILYVQRQLGHAKPSITLDIYSHFLEDDSPVRMVDALDTNSAPNRTPYAPKAKKEPATHR